MILNGSKEIGKDFSLVQGPGGNTSYKVNNKINMIKGIIYSGIFRDIAGFCKLVAQNWRKNFPSCVRVVVLLGGCLTVKN